MQVIDRLDGILSAFRGQGRDSLLPVLWQVQNDRFGRSFMNINTPEELAEARKLIAK
jgi:molybdopterin-guanine dinucleotide biosynthesis protein A